MKSILAALTLFTALGAPLAHAEGPLLRSGVSIHGPFTWGKTTADRSAYADPVYPSPEYDLSADLLRQVKDAGFDFIRLSVDPGPFMALTGKPRDALDARLLAMVKQIRAAKLDVLIDFHPIHMIEAYGPQRIESDKPLFELYTAAVGHTAHLLADDAAHVAIEPMNEPQLGYSAASASLWQAMIVKLYQAVEAQAPGMTVVIDGAQSGSMEGMLALDTAPFAQGDVRYSFHYYLPYLFTHQGVDAGNMPIRAFAAGLPYPPQAKDFDVFWATVEQRVNASSLDAAQKAKLLTEGKTMLREYFTHTKPDTIAADFNKVSEWALSHHIEPQHILMGEFSATQNSARGGGAAAEDRLRWLKAVREQAEQRGFSWAFWALYGESASGMTLVSVNDPKHLDPATAAALGKKVTP